MRRLFALALATTILGACSIEPVETTTTAPRSTSSTGHASTTSTPSATTTSTTMLPPVGEEAPVYFFFQGYPVEPGPYVVPVARPVGDDIEEALRALLEGVTEAEAGMGLSSTIPEGTSLLGVDVADGVAAVDLSRQFESGGGSLSMMGRVAQVVYTATSFGDVEAVRFLLEGVAIEFLGGEGLIIDEPQTRADYLDLTPAILVEEPLWGSTIASPVTISGQALTDSGSVSYVLVDADGLIIAEGETAVTPGQRSQFHTTLDIGDIPHPGLGSIIVFELAEDGTQIHVLEYPLEIG
jgi:Sporulation and spore germination/Immunoglobulin-like domain of bacterial spore germination